MVLNPLKIEGRTPVYVYKDVVAFEHVSSGFKINISGPPTTLGATLSLAWTLQEAFKGFMLKFPEITPTPLQVPGVATVGPVIKPDVRRELDKVQAVASISETIKAAIQNNSSLEYDLLQTMLALGLPIIHTEGWGATVTRTPTKVVGKVEGESKLFAELELGVAVEVFARLS
jgi:hypothetical protein